MTQASLAPTLKAMEVRRTRSEILAAVDEAEASLAHVDGCIITQESVQELAEQVKRRGRARLAAEQEAPRWPLAAGGFQHTTRIPRVLKVWISMPLRADHDHCSAFNLPRGTRCDVVVMRPTVSSRLRDKVKAVFELDR